MCIIYTTHSQIVMLQMEISLIYLILFSQRKLCQSMPDNQCITRCYATCQLTVFGNQSKTPIHASFNWFPPTISESKYTKRYIISNGTYSSRLKEIILYFANQHQVEGKAIYIHLDVNVGVSGTESIRYCNIGRAKLFLNSLVIKEVTISFYIKKRC